MYGRPCRVVLNCARLSLQQVFKLASITHALVNYYTCILLYFILLHIYDNFLRSVFKTVTFKFVFHGFFY